MRCCVIPNCQPTSSAQWVRGGVGGWRRHSCAPHVGRDNYMWLCVSCVWAAGPLQSGPVSFQAEEAESVPGLRRSGCAGVLLWPTRHRRWTAPTLKSASFKARPHDDKQTSALLACCQSVETSPSRMLTWCQGKKINPHWNRTKSNFSKSDDYNKIMQSEVNNSWMYAPQLHLNRAIMHMLRPGLLSQKALLGNNRTRSH